MEKVNLSESLFRIFICIIILKCWHNCCPATVIYHYKFLVFSSEHGAEEEQQYIEELLSYHDWGLIVLSHTLSSKQLSSYQIPIVAIEREAEYISSVTTDNYMGALQATTLLIRDKCDILIHINVNVEKTVPAYDRIRAFKETCEEYQVLMILI